MTGAGGVPGNCRDDIGRRVLSVNLDSAQSPAAPEGASVGVWPGYRPRLQFAIEKEMIRPVPSTTIVISGADGQRARERGRDLRAGVPAGSHGNC